MVVAADALRLGITNEQTTRALAALVVILLTLRQKLELKGLLNTCVDRAGYAAMLPLLIIWGRFGVDRNSVL
jgi:hypothetical protein